MENEYTSEELNFMNGLRDMDEQYEKDNPTIAEALPMCNCKGAREIKSVYPRFICRTCNRPVLYKDNAICVEVEVSLPKEFSDEI
jgi:hypothetical protein